MKAQFYCIVDKNNGKLFTHKKSDDFYSTRTKALYHKLIQAQRAVAIMPKYIQEQVEIRQGLVGDLA